MLGSLNICSIRGGAVKSTDLHGAPACVSEWNRSIDSRKESEDEVAFEARSRPGSPVDGCRADRGRGHGSDLHPTQPTHPTTTPKGHAYGYYCKGKSKKHVQGQKGTEFSQCVATLKQADNQDLTAKQACKKESKKHVKGEKGTAYSRCVTTVAHMQRDQHRAEREAQEQAQV
jgi:hypothetical protein